MTRYLRGREPPMTKPARIAGVGRLPTWRSIEPGVYAVCLSRDFVPPQVRRLIGFLVNAFTVPGWPA